MMFSLKSKWISKKRAETDHKSLSIQHLPNEMWIQVFESLYTPSDLFTVIQTCKYFYSLAIRVLYREIQWLSPFRYANNVPFWKADSSQMTLVPSSVTITVSLVNTHAFSRYDTAVTVVEADGSWRTRPGIQVTQTTFPQTNDYHISSLVPKKVFASQKLYADITSRISTFKMLRELIFHLCELPDTIFPAIKLLPRLNSLVIQYCTLPSLPSLDLEPDSSFSELPITDLTLWSLKGDNDAFHFSNYVYALYLCTAKNLRTLRIDWNPVTGRFLSRHNSIAPMTSLPTLEEVAIRFPTAKVWPSDDITSFQEDPLVTFLSGSPNIKRFSCQNRRSMFRFPDTVMPQLNHYHGAMIPVQELVITRPIEHLELTDMDKKTSDTLFILKQIAHYIPKLRSVCFNVVTWDDEILYALTSLFDDLCKIKIRFAIGQLEAQTLLSLGSQFLHRFPHLKMLHLFRSTFATATATDMTDAPSSPPPFVGLLYNLVPADDDQEVKECLNAWKKACPFLTDVQLTENFIWRRAFSGDEWCKRPIPSAGMGVRELY